MCTRVIRITGFAHYLVRQDEKIYFILKINQFIETIRVEISVNMRKQFQMKIPAFV